MKPLKTVIENSGFLTGDAFLRENKEWQRDETLDEYFERSDTPSKNSPVGTLMATIVRKFPGITFEAARAKANGLLNKAAGAKNYRFPQVLSEQEQEESRKRFEKFRATR